jgi:hypothetical protein
LNFNAELFYLLAYYFYVIKIQIWIYNMGDKKLIFPFTTQDSTIIESGEKFDFLKVSLVFFPIKLFSEAYLQANALIVCLLRYFIAHCYFFLLQTDLCTLFIFAGSNK